MFIVYRTISLNKLCPFKRRSKIYQSYTGSHWYGISGVSDTADVKEIIEAASVGCKTPLMPDSSGTVSDSADTVSALCNSMLMPYHQWWASYFSKVGVHEKWMSTYRTRGKQSFWEERANLRTPKINSWDKKKRTWSRSKLRLICRAGQTYYKK
jgi:hypothetical protein